MSRTAAIILNITITLAVVAYLTLAGILWSDKQSQNRCKKVKLEIIDRSEYGFVNDSVVNSWLAKASIKPIGTPVSEIDIYGVESTLKKHLFVDSVEVYVTMDGTMEVKLSQSIPQVRVMTDFGYDFYVDSELRILPIESHFRADIPIISGGARFGFSPQFFGQLNEKNHQMDREYLKKIINFVGFISADEFLQNLIVQIYVNDMGDIELIPRIGEQVILFGRVEDCGEKFLKLKKFYQKSLSQQWWLTAKTINLKYKNQVIVA